MYDLSIVLKFLNKLRSNNNREWFIEHKADYEEAHAQTVLFASALLDELNQQDNIETASGKKSLHRIYRDIRFSNDKTPYKTAFSGGFKRATEALRGGYFFRITPEGSALAGGFWGPNTDDLKLIREQIAADPYGLKDVFQLKDVKSYFGEMVGEQLKTAPKGFPKDHEAIEWLRYKQFLVKHDFTDNEVVQPDFHLQVAEGFKKMRPFFDYMSYILTTDLNGVSKI